MDTLILQVEGMSCGGCVKSVQQALTALPGVGRVDVDLASGRVEIECVPGQTLARDQAAAAVSGAGFDVV
ncbi:heavy-metal-associated domain-containing protein [Paludibacterium yongneupense]|uniref:heavy-metal-associated domain-containing protein n=1 Tax=Paludibacterium yongneupense TaxID=400061 RepID=UPI0004109CF0|nr:cation transporter [Paludibacterium yongneupense]